MFVRLFESAVSRASLCPSSVHLSAFCLDLYNISNTRGKVGTFCIFKTVYKIGEDVIGTFNFSEGDIPCLQVSADFITLRGKPGVLGGRVGERTGVALSCCGTSGETSVRHS